MNLSLWRKNILLLLVSMLVCCSALANEELFKKARTLQRDGKHEEAIETFMSYLSQPVGEDSQQLTLYIEALVQLMNTYQSKGAPEACIEALREVYKASPTLQDQCLRDYYSVLGYALSRTERMREAEETMLKALTLPLHRATPERYFRDYAYAAAVFYSNPDYQDEVIGWCLEALVQAEKCSNTSGKQWVTAMLGLLYKRDGHYYNVYASMGEGRETISYAMAENIEGPWTNMGELSGMAEDSFTIHPGVIDYKGKSYLFYHNSTISLDGYGPATGRRSICVDEMFYNADGSIRPVIQTKAGIAE